MRDPLYVVETYDTQRARSIDVYCLVRANTAEKAYQRFLELSSARRARLPEDRRHTILVMRTSPSVVSEVPDADPT